MRSIFRDGNKSSSAISKIYYHPEALRMCALRKKEHQQRVYKRNFTPPPRLFSAKGTTISSRWWSAKEKKYDINLICTRVHCHDNVFKCQLHERSAERTRALNRVRLHTTAFTRPSVGRRRDLHAVAMSHSAALVYVTSVQHG